MTVTTRPHELTVKLHTAEVDLTTASAFAAELDEAVRLAEQEEAHTLILDLEEVHYLDSGAVSSLLDLQERLAADGRRVRVEHLQRAVHRSLDVLGLLGVFAAD